MGNLRRPYQMYVLNLDAGRIFWLTTMLILLLGLSFFAGFLVGIEKAKSESELIFQKNKKAVDELISKIKESEEKKEEEYKFYDLITKRTEEEIKPVEEKPEERVKSFESSIKREEKIKPEITIEEGDKKISSKSPYAIQVASYTKFENAKALKEELENEQYPAYIIKSRVNGNIYYRVRVGPFSSKALTIKVLSQIRGIRECENSYIVTD